MPAYAVTGRAVVARPSGGKAVVAGGTAPAYPRPAHHHRVAAHAPATTNTNSKRACGQAAAISSPAVRIVAAVASVPRLLPPAERRLQLGNALAARAPPAGR